MSVPTVTVVGAGPAGGVAAVLLARRGWAVTIVEQSRFPRDKVCGECLSALAIETLTRHGLGLPLRALGAEPLRRATLLAIDGTAATLELPRPMWGLSRAAMDACLLDAARRAGAAVRQPARCEGVEPDDRGVTLRVRDLETNTVGPARSDWAIAADGRAAAGPARPPPTGDLGVKTHFAGVASPRDVITLFAARGHYGGLAPIEGGRWNVAMNVPAARVRACGGDLDALFDAVLRENPAMRGSFAGATRSSPWLTCPLPRFAPGGGWPARVVPVGNAAAALEPIGGEGMGLAIRSAELASAALAAAHAGDSRARARLGGEYRRLWGPRRAACRAAAVAVSMPLFGAAAIDAAASSEFLGRAALYLMGK